MSTQHTSRLAISLKEARQALGISRSLVYRMADDGRLPTVRVGRRRLVPVRALEELLSKTDEG